MIRPPLRNAARIWKVHRVLISVAAGLVLSLAVNVYLLWNRTSSDTDQSESQQTDPTGIVPTLQERRASAFALLAMKMREAELAKIEPQMFVPTTSRPATRRYPWKSNIVTTVFWIGQKTGIFHSLTSSAWDSDWIKSYGGVDQSDPAKRSEYAPIAFVPRQNPFYCALPYNDVTHGQFKTEAPLVIPWFKQELEQRAKAETPSESSVCWHRWVAIRKGNRTCYAQWEDCGPFRTDHFQYVFQNERPKPNASHGTGLSVSPAVRDYLGLAPIDVTDWQFVEVLDVAPGPWRSLGENNHFVIASRKSTEPTPSATPEHE